MLCAALSGLRLVRLIVRCPSWRLKVAVTCGPVLLGYGRVSYRRGSVKLRRAMVGFCVVERR